MLKTKLSFSPKQFWRGSLLRILPAAIVGFLPFTLLDNGLLELQYRLRGSRPPSPRLFVVSLAEYTDINSQVNFAREKGFRHVINFDTRKRAASPAVLNFDVTRRFLESDYVLLRNNLAPLLSPDSPDSRLPIRSLLYKGGLTVFAPENAESLAWSRRTFPDDKDVLVFVPARWEPQVPIPTQAGRFNQIELALNAVSNAADNAGLRSLPSPARFAITFFSTAAVAWLLYTFPTIVTLVLTLFLTAFHFVVAMIAFDKFGVQIPVVGPWVAMLAVYLLGISDRLDRRDREDWALAMRTENIQHLDEMRTNFLSLVSHDLKTPLARMQSVLRQLLRGDFGSIEASQKGELEKIISANGHLQRSINTMLLLSRIESNDIRLKREPADLNEILTACVKAVQPQAAERNIQLELQTEPLFLIDMDKALIHEVVTNLLDNSLKFSPTGSRIVVRSGELDNCPELSPPQPGIWFEVQDSGPGIPPDERSLVFQKFHRVRSERTAADQSVKGSGLGLYLSRYFVERHGGHLGALSRVPGEGVPDGAPAKEYFGREDTGTVMRVSLPIEAQTIEG